MTARLIALLASALLGLSASASAAKPAPKTAATDGGAGAPDAGSGEATVEQLAQLPSMIALRKRLAATESLTARFTQKRHWAALKDTLLTEGTLQYDRSGKMVWKTEKPSVSELTLEGASATMRFPALNTTQKFDLSSEPGMAKVFESITAVLKADLERLVPLYAVRVRKAAPLELELTPRNPQVASVVSRLHLTFNATPDLTGVTLEEPGGDSTEIAFRDHAVKMAAK